MYRIYYNNSTDKQHWSIDEGDPSTEICVMGIALRNVCARSVYRREQYGETWTSNTNSTVIGAGAVQHAVDPSEPCA